MRRLEEIQTNTMLDVGYDHQLECLEAQAAFCTGFQISSGAFEKIKKKVLWTMSHYEHVIFCEGAVVKSLLQCFYLSCTFKMLLFFCVF